MSLICASDGGICWIPGTGWRPVEDNGHACWINDAPYGGKYDAPALIEVARFDGHLIPADSWTLAVANDFTAPATVPLPASGVMMVAALVVAVIASRLKAP